MHSLLAGNLTSLNQAVGQLLELSTSEGLNQVLGHTAYGSDIRQVNLGGS